MNLNSTLLILVYLKILLQRWSNYVVNLRWRVNNYLIINFVLIIIQYLKNYHQESFSTAFIKFKNSIVCFRSSRRATTNHDQKKSVEYFR